MKHGFRNVLHNQNKLTRTLFVGNFYNVLTLYMNNFTKRTHTKNNNISSSRRRRIQEKALTGVKNIMAEIQHRITNAKIHPVENIQFRRVDSMICKDGFHVSIQAGLFYYSRPINAKGPYTHVEMGHASGPMPSLKKWKEGNIWTFVPLKSAAQVLNHHGGLITV